MKPTMKVVPAREKGRKSVEEKVDDVHVKKGDLVREESVGGGGRQHLEGGPVSPAPNLHPHSPLIFFEGVPLFFSLFYKST